MISTLHTVIAVCMLVLGAVALRRGGAARAPALLTALLCAGLAYDNIAVALGRPLDFGSALHAVNVPRYWIHALLTPLLIIAAGLIAVRLGVTRLATRPAAIAGGALVAALVALGTVTEILALRLEPRTYADTRRYVNTAAEGPPLPAIITIVALIAVGVLVWRAARTPWLCLGAIAMFAAAAVAFDHFWLGNLGELVLQAAIVATLVRAARPEPAPEPA